MSQDANQTETVTEDFPPEVLFINELDKYTAQLHGVSKLLEMCAHDDPDSPHASRFLALGHSVESIIGEISDSMMVFQVSISPAAKAIREGRDHE